jgi:hypothetical protein
MRILFDQAGFGHLSAQKYKRIFMVFLKSIFLISLILFIQAATPETIWCKTINLGCLKNTEKEKIFEKEFHNCEILASSSYRKGLIEALSDDTVWKFAGNTSAQDYAKMHENFMMSLCMKRVK